MNFQLYFSVRFLWIRKKHYPLSFVLKWKCISYTFSILQRRIVSWIGGFEFSWQACLIVCCSTMFFNHEDGSHTLLWNIGLSLNYRVLQSTRPNSSHFHGWYFLYIFVWAYSLPANLWTKWQIFMESDTTFKPLGTNFKFILLSYPLLTLSAWWTLGRRMALHMRCIHKISSVCKYCCCRAVVTMVRMCAESVGPLGRHGHHLQTTEPCLSIILCVYNVKENEEAYGM
jgi:hypothetical protein